MRLLLVREGELWLGGEQQHTRSTAEPLNRVECWDIKGGPCNTPCEGSGVYPCGVLLSMHVKASGPPA
jgi:hypothetical protein